MTIVAVAKRLLALYKSMRKQFSDLTSAIAFFMSSWTRSLVLGYTE